MHESLTNNQAALMLAIAIGDKYPACDKKNVKNVKIFAEYAKNAYLCIDKIRQVAINGVLAKKTKMKSLASQRKYKINAKIIERYYIYN